MQLQPKLNLTWKISATSRKRKNEKKKETRKFVAGHCFCLISSQSISFVDLLSWQYIKQCFSWTFVCFSRTSLDICKIALFTSSANDERHFQHIVLLFNIFIVLVLLLMNNNRSAQPNKCRVCMHHIHCVCRFVVLTVVNAAFNLIVLK